jgi:hypothetical protein
MAVYAVVGSGNTQAIKQSIVAQYGANHYEVAPYAWFVSDPGTSKDVADKLGISKGENNILGVVLRFDAYSGRHAANLWTWLQAIPGLMPNG